MSDIGITKEITMPQLAESLVSATLNKWLKQPGDAFEAYEPICEVFTEKVVAEIPATENGVMGMHLVHEGDVVEVGKVICTYHSGATAERSSGEAGIAEKVANGIGAARVGGGQHEPAAISNSVEATADKRRAIVEQVNIISNDENAPMRARLSPAVQRLASDYDVDLKHVQGSGLGGRITRKDVLQYIELRGNAEQEAVQQGVDLAKVGLTAAMPVETKMSHEQHQLNEEQLAGFDRDMPVDASSLSLPVRSSGLHLSESPRVPHIDVERPQTVGDGERFIDVTPIRNTIATRMRQSVSEIPHAWTMIEVDVTNLVELRNKWKDEFRRKEGVNLTYLAFVLKAVVNAIKDYPIMNSLWAVDKIIVKRDVNISLSVGTEDSVMVPVIKKADQKNIAGLAREIDDLARRTREGKLTLEDMQGGTFTFNNTGSFGSIQSYPIINYPQAAILTFESIVKRPVVINDMIAVRSMANMCLSLDHRILDGVICGRFLQRVKENLESYNSDTKLY
ncbi:dihydrolipoamide acetyltransferase family protein [Paenibacillus arenosi]|uniref:Dihydrolipoamide acetyltransferase component of pyruvate dehydrogenase complex n=1 Tax=Paenibacillus arenosi TaxID=2774142 RepID=A0ABR9AWX8_9BACL|nr:dihydrolipoamide acetyltransferase family protein [Paenibacillus arenosi]MBD8497705.1 2-oxo acid dehydrogenase subunit E2 [Paenibacillus arenosi]